MTRTELWARNPRFYIRECVEQGLFCFAWDRGYIRKQKIDPIRFTELHVPPQSDYRLLCVGDQGSAEYRRGSTLDAPVAVYPTWEYGAQPVDELEQMLANPIGANERACAEAAASDLPPDEVPVFGQEHRVVVIRGPRARGPAARQFYPLLSELQADYPDAIVHLHGSYKFAILFGNGFRAADCEFFIKARRGVVTLPTGLEVSIDDLEPHRKWVEMLPGWTIGRIRKHARERCLFSIASAQWASKHFLDDVDPRGGGKNEIEPAMLQSKAPPPIPTSVIPRTKDPHRDKVLCDYCTLSKRCPYYREGSVCSVPGSDASKIADEFKTRDPDKIIQGLAGLLELQGERVDVGMENERIAGRLDKETTKALHGMFDRGVALAKLVAPERFLKPAVAVNVGVGGSGNQVAIGAGTPRHQLVAAALAVFEERGIPRDQVTPEMLMSYFLSPEDPPALNATSSVKS